MAEAKRRLAAILAADVAGYSRLMSADERATMDTLNTYRTAFRKHIGSHDGRVVDTAGDSVLAVFDSVVEAVACAVDVQSDLATQNEDLPESRRMLFRIGVNLGDVFEQDDGTLYGDGVNVAARIEGLAEPGGVSVSESAHLQVGGKIDRELEYIGEHQVKNIDKPVRVYRIAALGKTAPIHRKWAHHWSPYSLLPLALIIVIAAVVFWPDFQPSRPTDVAIEPLTATLVGPSIAVLPFTNMSAEAGQDYFADGITEEIITALSQFSDLRVIARNSTFRYKGQAVDIRTIGDELGARYIVEGSVRRAAETIRVTAQLLDASDGSHLWAGTYDRDLSPKNIFIVQDEISQQVAATIGDQYGVIAQAVREKSNDRPDIELSSYECILLAYEYFQIFTPELHGRLRDCLEDAVVRDPEYPDAWGWLAIVYSHEHSMHLNPEPDSLDRALRAANNGVRVGPNNQLAYEGLAATYYFLHDKKNFIAAAEKAVALNPNDVSTIANIGNYYGMWGMYDIGLPLLDKAIALSPFPVWWYYNAYWQEAFDKGDYEAALGYAHKLALPGFWATPFRYVATYAMLGQIDEARAHLRTLLEIRPDMVGGLREEMSFWNWPRSIQDRVVEGFAMAGFDVSGDLAAEK